MLKKKLNYVRQKEVEEIIESMKVAVKHADSNIRNKLELLQAELHGLGARHNEAVALYNAAIASAKKSQFIHEQGLACERAGLYYKKMGFARDALVHFQQAHACYKEWGSSVKVGAIQRELDGFNSVDVVEGGKSCALVTYHSRLDCVKNDTFRCITNDDKVKMNL
eukprot:scaffold534_cov101-Skeletonema_marinoi.AAC.6